jgi:DNA-binding protein HU-beta
MNKSQLVDALADRLGDRRTAATAVDALLQIVVDTVRSGDSVSLAGFGVFESRARAARTGRNPRTGEAVDVPATTVPAFRPGTGFRNAVGGDAPPGRREPAASATNGAGGDAAGAALQGAVELTGPATTTLLAPTPKADGAAAPKPARGRKAKAAKDTGKATVKGTGKDVTKDVAKDVTKDKDKGRKKGKKGK